MTAITSCRLWILGWFFFSDENTLLLFYEILFCCCDLSIVFIIICFCSFNIKAFTARGSVTQCSTCSYQALR